MHKLVVRGYEGRRKFAEIGESSRKLKKLQEIKRVKKGKEYQNIPRPSLLMKAIRALPYKEYRNHDLYVYGKGLMTKHAMTKLYTIAEKNGVVNTAVRKEYALLMGDNIAWEKIEAIQPLGERELYDFTVDKDNFVGGLLLLHNSKYYGQSEENLRKKFEEAEKNAPSIIFIDEIDAIASKREESRGEVERRVVAQLLALMDGLKSRGKVVVIAATNIPNLLDPALRRPGRFDREIEIGVPDREGRLNILKIHTRNMPLAKNVNLKDIANITYGFVGADLAALAKESAMIVLRRVFPDLRLDQEEAIPKELLEKLRITQKDFREALKVVRPSAMREVLVEIPNVKWNDIGGLEEVKQELIEAVEWPLKYPDSFKRLGVKPPKGVLLYGAPGTGKTLLAKAVANESEANFILVKGPELLSKWIGESEKAVREVFRKARQTAPTIVFFDEVDAIAPRRGMSSDSHVTERVVNQILTEIDGLEDLHDVVIIGATNRPDILDTSLLRPGRFDRIILVKSPNKTARLAIFKVHAKEMPLGKDVDLDKLADETEGYAGADIEGVCKEAAIFALREDMKAKEVGMVHFRKGMEKVRPSITPEIEKAYEELLEHFKAARAKQLREERPAYMG
ncbi:AAA family ATPase [Candidatus Woesearchaeota archaeon]|nr:AAA family ATPase [Candidatus Woesearchaeota archaeon]